MTELKIILTAGNRAVIINRHSEGGFWSNLYVNARDGIANASITALRSTHNTEAGARRWAAKQLAA
jgi:hypothetical protein